MYLFQVEARKVAKGGFYHTGTDANEVACSWCGCRISHWDYGDQVRHIPTNIISISLGVKTIHCRNIPKNNIFLSSSGDGPTPLGEPRLPLHPQQVQQRPPHPKHEHRRGRK